MAQAIITLISNFIRFVVDDSANTASFQTYDSSNSTWNTQVTFNVSNGQITLEQLLNIAQSITPATNPLTINGDLYVNGGQLGLGDVSDLFLKQSGFMALITQALTMTVSSGDFLYLGGSTSGTSPSWNGWPAFSTPATNDIQVAPLGAATSQKNTLDDGSGNMAANPATTSLAGTTAGTIDWIQPERGTRKVFIAVASGYENDTTTNQTITFPVAFANTPAVSVNTTGLTVSATTTTLTITAPDATTVYNGVIEVLGI